MHEQTNAMIVAMIVSTIFGFIVGFLSLPREASFSIRFGMAFMGAGVGFTGSGFVILVIERLTR